MKKIIVTILLIIFPALVMAADGSLTFTPPASDVSVIFLGNIFGIVDGVLHGSGSQMMGTVFGVFNAAVLALGGIIIMYTLMVSTLNTAQEGQFLGQKWSSLWVPVRTTFGLALLIPKASGYCLMQIFVMWIVLQGVGAADKIWNAALDYLNRGGSIVMAQENPAMALTKGKESGVLNGAQVILSGQVCMLGLEAQLKAQRQMYLKQKDSKLGPCYGDVAPEMQDFCTRPVPSFVNTVNAVAVRNQDPQSLKNNYAVPMPNFDQYSSYANLNGICGTISWNRKDISFANQLAQGGGSDAMTMSRAIAIQQMFTDLTTVAQVIVNNNPQLSDTTQDSQTSNYSPIAEQQFGVPLDQNGGPCAYTCGGLGICFSTCVTWGQQPGSQSAPLFNGSEFRGAIADYDGVMRPVLTLESEMQNQSATNDARKFIQGAEAQGWIMAGSYFFNLILLNQQAVAAGSDLQDSGTGLEQSKFDPTVLQFIFSKNGCNQISQFKMLCTWLGNDSTTVEPIVQLITGGGSIPTAPSDTKTPVYNQASSTVQGFVDNSNLMALPGQPGQAGVSFADQMHIKVDSSSYTLPSANFDCGEIKILFFKVCLGRMMGEVFYNGIILPIYNLFLGMINALIEKIIFTFLLLPLQGMSAIFKQGVTIISQPGVNPIVALAQMGTFYINFAGELWLLLMELTIAGALVPIFGIVVFAILSFSLPLLLAWTTIMVAIGFVTAYYVPLLPYMIFTFATIAWLIAVIEAMVAAPIVALGVTHPEGHEAFGKGETAIMILMNVFLRPSMMIIGYIAAISLSYVGVWLLNAGFDQAVSFIQAPGTSSTLIDTTTPSTGAGVAYGVSPAAGLIYQNLPGSSDTGAGSVAGGYTGWAGIFAYFFSILMYTSIYMIIVQKSFTLITYLPDKVLRWIGGAPESVGGEAAQWAEEAKGRVEKGGESTSGAQAAMHKQLSGYAQKGASKARGMMKGAMSTPSVSAKGESGSEGGGKGAGPAAQTPKAGE